MSARWKRILAGVLAGILVLGSVKETMLVSVAATDTEVTEQSTEKEQQTEVTTEKPSAEETSTEEETTEEVSTETVSTEEISTEETTEEDTEEDADMDTSSIATYAAPSAANSVNIPQNIADVEKGHIYTVSTYDDILALQELSYQSSLEGCVFQFTKLNSTILEWNLTNIGFTGLGNETYPFKGVVQEYFDTGVNFTLSRPLFNYLGSGAEIKNFNLILKNATSGLADHFIIGADGAQITYTNVKLSGTVVNKDGAAGALYGIVSNEGSTDYEIPIDGKELDVTGITVSGQIAGGLIGEVSGQVVLRVTDGKNLAGSVTSTGLAAGGIAGQLDEGSSLIMTDEAITIKNSVSGTGSIGGVVGIASGAVITTGDKGITRTGTVVSSGTAGNLATGNAGGFVGLIKDGQTTIRNFKITAGVRSDDNNKSTVNYAGGVVGRYESTKDTASLFISGIGIAKSVRVAAGGSMETRSSITDSGCSSAGGVIGSIAGSHVKIEDIQSDDADYPFQPEMRYHGYGSFTEGYYNTSLSGGLIGDLEGQDIEISDIKLAFTSSNGITGYSVGDIAGYIKPESKVRMTDITIASHYTGYYSRNNAAPVYGGGIVGYVGKGSIVALGGKIDVSGISYRHWNGSLVPGGLYATNAGYIAGAQTEAILYLEKDATYIKNDQATDPTNSVWTTTDFYNSSYGDNIDDVGTYGGLYRNIEDADGNPVIQYDAAYGSEVTGTIEFKDGSYQIKSDADALRLALALNTFDANTTGHPLRFGANCFAEDVTADDLLSASYVITGNLDFETTGIYSLSRNDSLSYPFKGSISGADSSHASEIKLHILTKQLYAGLFPQVEDASFSNLKLTGDIYYAQNAAGIAPFGKGNLTVKNVTTEVGIHAYSYIRYYTNNTIHYYGGLIGFQTLAGGKITITGSKLSPTIDNIRVHQMAAGAIARIDTGKTAQSDGDKNIVVSQTTIGANLIASQDFQKNYGATGHARVGGLFADIGYDYANNQFTSINVGGTMADATYAGMLLTDITISDASVDTSKISANLGNVRATGGLLGYSWRNVDVEVTADENAQALKVTDSSIKSAGFVGGLITILGGRMVFDGKVALESLTMKASTSNTTYSGFLVGDGRNAIVTITAADYTVGRSSATGYSNFDEIVGLNQNLQNNAINTNAYALTESRSNAGIVNIIMPEFADMTTNDYDSYVNQKISGENKYTRYYYNLFTSDYDNNHITVSGTTGEIDTPEKLMLLSVAKYASDKLRHYLTPYFGNVNYSTVNTWNLSGNFDMNGYSYYPMEVGGSYLGDGSAMLKLYGEELAAKEADNKLPADANSQHYLMHAGLFRNVSGLTVKNLTLQGTATQLSSYSGALITGKASGNITIEGITCDGIRLANYTNEAYQGLLIGYIIDGSDVTLKGITTTGYADDVYAAAALIGQAGDVNTKSVKVHFEHMKVEDKKDTLFKYASFIYYYDYTDDINKNSSFGLYLFSKDDDTAEDVTYGAELALGVHYKDRDQDAHLQDIIANAKNDEYNPYVYTLKHIFVNPRNGNLTEGCGTYEDPYIITNGKQLLSLYCYLTGNVSYNSMFAMDGTEATAWLVNPIANGAEDGRCADPTTHTAEMFTATNTNFPTRDELRTAYYLITEDVDLSSYQDLNDVVINQDFSGIGSTAYPFAGVMAGRKLDGSRPTITLPDTVEGRSQNNYGLFQYVKGAAIKDLIIYDIQGADSTKTSNICVSENGAGVAAVVLGGDNIIDHVEVNLGTRISREGSLNVTAATGAYVGTVRRGTVLIRNMETSDIENYRTEYYKDGAYQKLTKAAFLADTTTYKKNSQLIGWVQDGAVFYEDTTKDFKTDTATLEQDDFGLATQTLSYSFPLINEDYLNAGNGADDNQGRIVVTGDTTTGYTFTISDSEQLEIAAAALNSGAFSGYNSGKTSSNHYNAYDASAICRKAAYSDLGFKQADVNAAEPADFILATQNDDNHWNYPYIYYRYMNFDNVAGGYEATYVTSGDQSLSVLNWSDASNALYGGVSIGDVVTNYELVAGHNYDLTAYGRSFRGFGALYSPVEGNTTYNYAVFKANFNGNGANVTFDMNRDWDSSIVTTGMFNDLTVYRPENTNLSTGVNASADGGFTIENINLENSSVTASAAETSYSGLIAGNVKGIWNFTELHATGEADSVYDPATGEVNKAASAADNTPKATLATYTPTVSSKSIAGGLVGIIKYYSGSANDRNKQKISFTNCSMTNGYVTGKTYVGGLAGYLEGNTTKWNNSYFGTVAFTGCSVKNSTIWSDDGAHVGGFLGRAGNACDDGNTGYTARGIFSITAATVSNVSVQNNATRSYTAGGLIGILQNWNDQTNTVSEAVKFSDITLEGITAISKGTASGYYGIGGMLGALWGNSQTVSDITVKQSWIGYNNAQPVQGVALAAGGVFGVVTYSDKALKNITVEDTNIGSYSSAAGGIIGRSDAATLTITADDGKTNVISNAEISSYGDSAGGVVGVQGASNSAARKLTFGNIAVENSRIYNRNVYNLLNNQNVNPAYSVGGILGRTQDVYGNYTLALQLSDLSVGDGTEIAGTHSGGIAGMVSNDNTSITMSGGIYVGFAKTAGSVKEDSVYTNIYSNSAAGGIFGYTTIGGTQNSTADVQVQKTRIGTYTTGNSIAYSGGITGCLNMGGSNNGNNIVFDAANIKDCIITANNSNREIRAGGLYGMISERNNNSSSSYVRFYNPKLTDNSIGYAEDMNSLDKLKQIENTEGSVKLLSGTTGSIYWKYIPVLNETTVGQYSRRIGNLVGVWNSTQKQLYVLRPEISYTSGFNGSRPVVDVGNNTAGSGLTSYGTTPYGYDSPYDYRKTCHIVYFEPDSADAASNYLDAELIAGADNENEYLFGRLDDIVTEYNEGNNSGEDFLDAYRLHINMDTDGTSMLDYYNKCNKKLNNVQVVYADGGTAQTILDSIAGILTNAGGIYSTPSDAKITTYLNVSVSKAKITSDGKIVADSGRTGQSIVAANNIIKYQNLSYDGQNADGSYTISLVKYRYGWTGADNVAHYETLYIPVFVVERIAFYNTLSIMEGEQYSLTKAHDSSVSYTGEVTVAHDSTYTLFVEMAYGEGRKKYPSLESAAKVLTFEESNGTDASGNTIWTSATIPGGMKMTLVDVQTGKAYYYTEPYETDADYTPTSELDFTKFKDVDGNSYTYRKLSEITNTTTSYQYGDDTSMTGYEFGLEQFYIYVDPSDVTNIQNSIFKLSVSTDATKEETLNFLDRKESSGIQITWMPGLSISFAGKGNAGATYIDGNINKEHPIEIDSQIQVTAPGPYWDEKEVSGKFIDSENNNKYLDVAIYLIDQASGAYVNLPEGTNIILDNNSPHAAVSQYVTYGYKDWGSVFPINIISENSTTKETLTGQDGSTVNNYFHVTLDFSLANIDDYVGKNYNILLELRRTANPDYPLGDKRIDEYSNSVEGIGYKDMAVAMEIEDIMDLGINTYRQTESTYEIPFETKLDFNNAIVNEADLETCVEQKYLITYRLKKKVKKGNGYEYVSVGSGGSGLELGEELKLYTAKKSGSKTEYEELPLKTYDGETVYQVEKEFTKKELKNGLNGIRYLIGWDNLLKIDTDGIADEDLSNYMVEVKVLPYQTEDIPANDASAALEDYYVFTISKIKTDM